MSTKSIWIGFSEAEVSWQLGKGIFLNTIAVTMWSIHDIGLLLYPVHGGKKQKDNIAAAFTCWL